MEWAVQPSAGKSLRSGITRAARAVVRFGVIDQAAKVAGQHLLRRRRCGIGCASWATNKVGSLIVEEEEEVVLDGRAADRAAELLASIDVGISAFRVDPISSVEIGVAHEFK